MRKSNFLISLRSSRRWKSSSPHACFDTSAQHAFTSSMAFALSMLRSSASRSFAVPFGFFGGGFASSKASPNSCAAYSPVCCSIGISSAGVVA